MTTRLVENEDVEKIILARLILRHDIVPYTINRYYQNFVSFKLRDFINLDEVSVPKHSRIRDRINIKQIIPPYKF